MHEGEEQELAQFLKGRQSVRQFVDTIFESSGINPQGAERLKDHLTEVWDIAFAKFPEAFWNIEVVVVGKGGTFRENRPYRKQLLIPDISDESEDYVRWRFACLTAHAVLQHWAPSTEPISDRAANILSRSWGFPPPKNNEKEE